MFTDKRWPCGLALLLALTGMDLIPPALAQVMVWKEGQDDFERPAPTSDAELETVVTVTPMPEPTPALKYRFWKSPALREPGNVNAPMNRALLLYLSHAKRNELDRQYADRAETWVDGPLGELPETDLPDYLTAHRGILDMLYASVKLDTIDRHMTDRNRTGMEAINLNLDDVSQLRNLARLLQLDGRLAIAEGRYADAIETIAAGFRLAEYNIASGDAMLVRGLVTTAICGIMFIVVDELSQQADAPNLYWALAGLPEELWSLRAWLDGEMAWTERAMQPVFKPLPVGADRLESRERLIEAARLILAFGQSTGPRSDKDGAGSEQLSRLLAGAAVMALADRAADQLVAMGLPNEQVSRMDPAMAVLTNIRLKFETPRDELFKWAMLAELDTGYTDAQWQRFESGMQGPELADPANVLVGLLMPAVQAADGAVLRTRARRAQLMLRESLRAYAAANGDQLPESLENLQPLPALPQPFIRDLFEYQRISPTEAIVTREPFYSRDEHARIRIIINVD